jgi:tetratricopeptide (TPR) repeat protein
MMDPSVDNPENPAWERGMALSNQEDYASAHAAFTQVIVRDPQDADAYLQRGWCSFYLSHWEEALADWRQAVALNPDLEEETLLAPPPTPYDDMVAADPSDPVGYYRRGIAYYSDALYEYALADFTQAIALDPTYADAYYWRAATYGELGNPDQVLADLSQVIVLEPDGVTAYYHRGIIYLEQGDHARAHADFQHVVDLSDDPEVQDRARGVLRGRSWIPMPTRPETGRRTDTAGP